MTQALDALSRRMTTLQSIRGVVRTMKTLAAVNAAPYGAAASAIDQYHATILDGLQILMHATGRQLAAPPTSASPGIMLVFGSDHGLCGGYNEVVADRAVARIDSDEWLVLSVGAKMAMALADRSVAPDRRFQPPASADGIGRLASEVLIALDGMRAEPRGEEREVVMTYMTMDAHKGRAPVVTPLLPLDPALVADLARRPWASRCLPMVTMPSDTLFAALVRNHLFAGVFRAAAEAMATENAARLALMQQAERAIDDRLADLLLATRSARQSEVTNELLDVIAGFEALKKP